MGLIHAAAASICKTEISQRCTDLLHGPPWWHWTIYLVSMAAVVVAAHFFIRK